MMLNLIDKIGDWNPQLLREIKGRLKVVNVIVAVVISLVGQLVIFLYQLGDFPGNKYSMSQPYCNLSTVYQQQISSVARLANEAQQKINYYSGIKNYDLGKIQELKTQLKHLNLQRDRLNKILYEQFCPPEQINIQLWWRDHWEYIFLSLSVIFIFTLLVAGTYLLINNLAQEERRGTLNFIRLSPQSEANILIGKILGVPIFIYLLLLTAVPLHLWAGISAKLAFSHILSFYVVLAASCFFFYSSALLFGLISSWFSSFQPWLASGAVLFFLIITMQLARYTSDFQNTAAWLRLLSPFYFTSYLFPNLFHQYNDLQFRKSLAELQFFYLPLGKSLVGIIGLHLFNYAVGIYWVWQALKRRFRNPNAAILSKKQSYLFVTCCQVLFWGFTLQSYNNHCYPYRTNCYYDLNHQIGENFVFIALFNLVLLFGLLAALSPHRQKILDWARYRHQNFSSSHSFGNKSLWQDLIWGEKSPAIVAMAINLVIVTASFIVWIVLAPVLNIHHSNSIDWVNTIGRMKLILAVALFISLMMIYTTLAQRMLLMKTPKRSLWAIGTVGAAMFLPLIILGILGIKPIDNSIVWLFSTFPWASVEYSTVPTIFMALLAELSVLVLLNLQLVKQVRLAGESTTKALLAGR